MARWSKTDYSTSRTALKDRDSERLAIVARSVTVDSRHTGAIGIDWWKRLDDDRLRHAFSLE